MCDNSRSQCNGNCQIDSGNIEFNDRLRDTHDVICKRHSEVNNFCNKSISIKGIAVQDVGVNVIGSHVVRSTCGAQTSVSCVSSGSVTTCVISDCNFTDQNLLCNCENTSTTEFESDNVKDNYKKADVCTSLRFTGLKSLQYLNLSHCKLVNLPEEMLVLKNLLSLNVSYNNLNSLPKCFNSFKKLINLNLCHNRFRNLPECILEGYLWALIYLNMSYNNLVDFNVKRQSLQLLKYLNLSDNQLMRFPAWLLERNCNVIVYLDLSNNKNLYNDVTMDELFTLRAMKNSLSKSLKTLISSNCSLYKKKLEVLSAFLCITVLDLSNETIQCTGLENILTDLRFCDLPNYENIVELYISNVTLQNISNDIKKLSNLRTLDVSHNELLSLPSELCSLTRLKVLYASHNTVPSLPEEFGNLESLNKLYLSSNQLCDLPASMRSLVNLEVLDLYDNCFDIVPEIIKHMNLKELDISYNFLDPSLIHNGTEWDTHMYRKLREEFLKNNKEASSRSENQQLISDDELDDDSYDSHHWPKDDSSVEDYEEQNYPLKESETLVKAVEDSLPQKAEEEDWDVEYDSDDYFDPNRVSTVVKVTRFPHLCFKYDECSFMLNTDNGYCPATYHPQKSVRVEKKIDLFSKLVEGQFDDA